MTAKSTVPAGAFERLQSFAARIGCTATKFDSPQSGELWRIEGPLEVVYNPQTYCVQVIGTRNWRHTTSPAEAALAAVRPPPLCPVDERIRIRPEHRRRLIRSLSTKKNQKVCRWCRRRLSDAQITMDHIVPVALGGTSDLLNLVPACYSCNLERSHYMPELDGWRPRRRKEAPDVA